MGSGVGYAQDAPDGPGGVGRTDGTSDLLSWLRAEDLVLNDGDFVNTWPDASGNDNDATPLNGNADNRPKLYSDTLSNGNPAVAIDSLNGDFDALQLNDDNRYEQLDGRDLTALVVMEYPSEEKVASNIIGNLYDSSIGWAASITPSAYRGFFYTTDVIFFPFGGTPSSETTTLVGVKKQGLDIFWSADGELLFSRELASESSTDDGNRVQLRGTTIAAEVVVFGRALQGAELTLVENYLSAKHDFALQGSATDVYAGDQSGNGDYDLGVFGVGQEAAATETTGETDGLRFDVSSGLDNNGEYLVAGHRVPENTVLVSDTSSGFAADIDARMERTWYVDRDDDGNLTVDVTVDLSEAGLAGPANNASDLALVSRTADAATGTDWNAVQNGADAINNGDEIVFNDVSLSNGNEITLATVDQVNTPIGGPKIVLEGTAGNEGTVDSSPSGKDRGFAMLGPPESGGTFGGLASDTDPQLIEFGLPGPMIYTYDAVNSEWTEVTQPSDPLPSGEGFLLYVFDDKGSREGDPVDPTLPITVSDGSGVPTADQTVSFSSSADQWLFVANPFAVPFDLANVSVSGGSGVVNTAQTYDQSADSYETLNGPGSVDPDTVGVGQGFFLECSTTGDCPTEVTLETGGRVAGDRSVVGYKSAEGLPAKYAAFSLAMTVEADGDTVAMDPAAEVVFHEEASDGWDRYDATKLPPLVKDYAALAPVTPAGDSLRRVAQAGRSWPETTDPIEVPLDVTAKGVSGTATVQLTERVQGDGWTVEVVDTTDGTTHRLTEGGGGYQFTVSSSKSAASAADPGRAEERQAPVPRALPLSGRSAEAQRKKVEKNSKGETRLRLRLTPSSETLPVELAGFEAQMEGPRAALQWATASEAGNAGFAVEHKPLGDTTATAASAEWTEIGFVEGAGTTQQPQRYEYTTDKLAHGRHSFRLRQIDRDGTETTTEAVTVERRLEEAYAVESPYPNPTEGAATLPVRVQTRQTVTIQLYDVLGRKVKTVRRTDLAPHTTHSISVGTERLASGQYFVRVRGADFSTTRRLIVAR